MMVDPPLEDGAFHDTTDEALAFEVALTEVGAPGTVFLVDHLYAERLALVPSDPLWDEELPAAWVWAAAIALDGAVAARPRPLMASREANSEPMAADVERFMAIPGRLGW